LELPYKEIEKPAGTCGKDCFARHRLRSYIGRVFGPNQPAATSFSSPDRRRHKEREADD
jgi:hypothetical protein